MRTPVAGRTRLFGARERPRQISIGPSFGRAAVAANAVFPAGITGDQHLASFVTLASAVLLLLSLATGSQSGISGDRKGEAVHIEPGVAGQA